ncbi:MAG: hypothetical protein U0984_07010 [Prosthecobacter sp.]|nr:hypothetical protein [Prosthecobacter sp.]
MTEFQDIQRLIRLKRFENPGEDFVEDFVNQFRERQRSEMLRQSARGLLWERLTTYFEHLLAPKWVTAAATAAICLLGTWGALSFVGGSHSDGPALAALQAPESVGPALQPSLAVDSPLIKEAEMAQGHPIEIENILLSRHFEGDQSLEPQVAGVSGAANPTSPGFFPVVDFGR